MNYTLLRRIVVSAMLASIVGFGVGLAGEADAQMPPNIPMVPDGLIPKMDDLPPPPPDDASCDQICDWTEDVCKKNCKKKKVDGCDGGCARTSAQCMSKCQEEGG